MNIQVATVTEAAPKFTAIKPVYNRKMKEFRVEVVHAIPGMDILQYAMSGYFVFNSVDHIKNTILSAPEVRMAGWDGKKLAAVVKWFNAH